jgi:hypothetical protein
VVAVHRAIQNSQASGTKQVGRYGINPKTAAKWRQLAYKKWLHGIDPLVMARQLWLT